MDQKQNKPILIQNVQKANQDNTSGSGDNSQGNVNFINQHNNQNSEATIHHTVQYNKKQYDYGNNGNRPSITGEQPNQRLNINHQNCKFATWNIRGLNKQGRREAIARFMHLHNIDIFAIQESKVAHSSKKQFKAEYSEIGG